jgi:hypothetical protein
MKAKEARRMLKERQVLTERHAEAERRVEEGAVRTLGVAAAIADTLERREGAITLIREIETKIERARRTLAEAQDFVVDLDDVLSGMERLKREIESEAEDAAIGRDKLALALDDPRFADAEERLRVVAEVEAARKQAEALTPENLEGLKWLARVYSAVPRERLIEDEKYREDEEQDAAEREGGVS